MKLDISKSILKYLLFASFLLAGILLLLFYPNKPPSIIDLNTKTFERLENLKKKKEEAIVKFLETSEKNARKILNDDFLLKYFFSSCKNEKDNLQDSYELDKYFISEYYDYFDLLFINKDGLVFNTIRHENDYHKNIFKGELNNTLLSKKLRVNKNVRFINYEFYPPSKEFAAFFPVAVYKNKTFFGWIVLQLPLNPLNAILLDRNGLGKTGEIYLVNTNKQLLTESRFIGNASLKNIVINTQAVNNALSNNSGKDIIKDYRGVNVYSVYSKIDFLENYFVIIAEIDEDEVLTNYFVENSSYYLNKITANYSKRNIININYTIDKSKLNRVDVNEFAKTDGNNILFTKGIATCSAAVFFMPDKFGYLSHITPLDQTYYSNSFIKEITDFSLKFLFSTQTTDFIKDITQRIIYYEVLPYQLDNLKFVFIANHKKSFENAIKKVTREGLNISKIKFMYNPKAESSNAYFDLAKNEVIVEWFYKNNNKLFESSINVKSIGTIMKELN